MTYPAYDTLKQALDRDLPVLAHVSLLDGHNQRLRVGPVASLSQTHVTIFDTLEDEHGTQKGFRTTPLGLVREVKILEPRRSLFARIFDALRRAVFGA